MNMRAGRKRNANREVKEEEEGHSPNHYELDEATGAFNDETNDCGSCCWNKRIEKKLDRLTDSVKQLKRTIDEMTDTSTEHNITIIETINAQTNLIQEFMKSERNTNEFPNIFPIRTIEGLTEADNQINQKNRPNFIRCMSFLIKGPLSRTITEILSSDLILQSNVDGTHGKVELKRFKNFFDVLVKAVRARGDEDPIHSLRDAFRMTKRRHFKKVSMGRKRVKNDPDCEDDDDDANEGDDDDVRDDEDETILS